jgi:hypothetical protein
VETTLRTFMGADCSSFSAHPFSGTSKVSTGFVDIAVDGADFMKRHTRKWSAEVMKKSDALDLEPEIFQSSNPKAIARSLKRSANSSHRRKAEPFRSAMSMLTFYINRAGRNLTRSRRRTLEAAKNELRLAFGRAPK